jgi:paraquat-inducible protein B
VIPGELEGIEATIAKIVKKLDKLPLEQIGTDVTRCWCSSIRRSRAGADARHRERRHLADSALRVDLANTLQEVSRAARSIRVLGDYLERHPDALLRGKSGEPK